MAVAVSLLWSCSAVSQEDEELAQFDKYVAAMEELSNIVLEHRAECPELARAVASFAAERGPALAEAERAFLLMEPAAQQALEARYKERLQRIDDGMGELSACLGEPAVAEAFEKLSRGASPTLTPEEAAEATEAWFGIAEAIVERVEAHPGDCPAAARAVEELMARERPRFQALANKLGSLDAKVRAELMDRHADRAAALDAALGRMPCFENAAVLEAIGDL